MLRLITRLLLSLYVLFLGGFASSHLLGYGTKQQPATLNYRSLSPSIVKLSEDIPDANTLVRSAWHIKGKVNDKIYTSDDDDDDESETSSVRRITTASACIVTSSRHIIPHAAAFTASSPFFYHKHLAYVTTPLHILFSVYRI